MGEKSRTFFAATPTVQIFPDNARVTLRGGDTVGRKGRIQGGIGGLTLELKDPIVQGNFGSVGSFEWQSEGFRGLRKKNPDGTTPRNMLHLSGVAVDAHLQFVVAGLAERHSDPAVVGHLFSSPLLFKMRLSEW
jgi:hypothetical protein